MILKYITVEINRVLLKETCNDAKLQESVFDDKCVDDVFFAPVVDWLCDMLTRQKY